MPSFSAVVVLAIVLAVLVGVLVAVTPPAAAQESASDFTEAVKTVDQFREALLNRDSLLAAELLLDDVRILGSGGDKVKEEYLGLDFESDADFLASMTSGSEIREVSGQGDVAWVTTTSWLQGTYDDREVSLNSTEMMILRRTKDGWRIAAIHSCWCSD